MSRWPVDAFVVLFCWGNVTTFVDCRLDGVSACFCSQLLHFIALKNGTLLVFNNVFTRLNFKFVGWGSGNVAFCIHGLLLSFPKRGKLNVHLPATCQTTELFPAPSPESLRYILCWIMAPIVFVCLGNIFSGVSECVLLSGACHLQRVLFTDEGVQKISTNTEGKVGWYRGSGWLSRKANGCAEATVN